MTHLSPPEVETLNGYLKVCQDRYAACIDVVTPSLGPTHPNVTLRFHHVKFDSNGQPKFKALAQALFDHIVLYAYSARRQREAVTPQDYTNLVNQARKTFRLDPTGGESGEMILYMLLEAVLGAPQLIAKMDLKTNRKAEVLGSDGVHMRWHEEDGLLDVYFGEAKLEQSISNALDHAFASMEKFHFDGAQKHEVSLVTSHYKWTEEPLRTKVLNFLDETHPSPDARINHACLIGYDWNEYGKVAHLGFPATVAEFRKRYEADGPRLQKLLDKRFDKFAHKKLRFDVFFLPFETVQAFRDAFNEILS